MKMKRVALMAATAGLCGLSASTWADCGSGSKTPCQPAAPSAPPSRADMQQQMNDMVPMFGNMASSMLQGRLAALSDPNTATQLAKFHRNLYNALMAQGFDAEQALRIVMAVGLPSAQ